MFFSCSGRLFAAGVATFALLFSAAEASANIYSGLCLNAMDNCNGHGECHSITKTCSCHDGWGSPTDIVDTPIAPDCSERVCPSNKAWQAIPTATDAAHGYRECSGRGKCQRLSGVCICFQGFEGKDCSRNACGDPTSETCSGHGRCQNLREMSKTEQAQPISAATSYGGQPTTGTWDEDMIHGCICDSSWSVGLAAGETQLPEWFGPSCSKRRCPSGDDPLTAADETDCEGKLQDPIFGTTTADLSGGATGNLCHVDCSNRGTCDYTLGLCRCYDGYTGANCGTQDALYRGFTGAIPKS